MQRDKANEMIHFHSIVWFHHPFFSMYMFMYKISVFNWNKYIPKIEVNKILLFIYNIIEKDF